MSLKLKKYLYLLCDTLTVLMVCAIIYLNYNSYNMKYVLIWTSPNSEIFYPMGRGNKVFYDRKCPVKNCYITNKKHYLPNIYDFDAILFHGPEIIKKRLTFFPKERSPNQSYIFASIESPQNYKAPDTRFHGVFNFTWTYKLNSDISFRYMVIRDRKGNIIGPSETIEWMDIDDMLPINNSIKSKLANKRKAAAWFVSNCETNSGRETLAIKIGKEMLKHKMTLDIYGNCGKMKCPRNSKEQCLKLLQRDYYFYFAFENSLGDDYVTEKLRNALQNYVVPIVYGAADYSRFMPDGIYIDATEINVTNIVKLMADSIKYKELYYDYFKWHNHYSYHDPEETPETDPYCSLCKFINNVKLNQSRSIENFIGWWNSYEVIHNMIKERVPRP